LILGLQVPDVGVKVSALFWAYQAVEIVSSAVLTAMLRVLGAASVPEIVIEMPLKAEASSSEQAFQ
jgi:hypothetical protein